MSRDGFGWTRSLFCIGEEGSFIGGVLWFSGELMCSGCLGGRVVRPCVPWFAIGGRCEVGPLGSVVSVAMVGISGCGDGSVLVSLRVGIGGSGSRWVCVFVRVGGGVPLWLG